MFTLPQPALHEEWISICNDCESQTVAELASCPRIAELNLHSNAQQNTYTYWKLKVQ